MPTLRLPELSPAQNEILRIAFRLLLETGRPVSLATIHRQRRHATTSIEQETASLKAAGRIRLDDGGDVTGAFGLSLDATPHRIYIGQSQWFTWCAIDALGILGALDATGEIQSISPLTGRPIQITFKEGKPAHGDLASVVFLPEHRPGTPVVDQWCPTVNFFETAEAARTWADNRGIDGEAHAVPLAAQEATRRWKERLD